MVGRPQRVARVYLGPEPERGPHPGYLGPITLDQLGAHIGADCEYLSVSDVPADWPNSEWQPVETRCLIPWHRIDAVEWPERR